LSWDGFWRFARDLDFGLSDTEIAKLRQKADKDMDGYIDWNEMVEVFLPLLVIKLRDPFNTFRFKPASFSHHYF
jgi:hypothetical protein